MGVAICPIDGDEIRRRQVCIVVGMIGAGMVNIVGHPSESRRPVQLNCRCSNASLLLRIFRPSLSSLRSMAWPGSGSERPGEGRHLAE